MSGLDLFGAGDVADLPDGIHPNRDGQARIAERFERLTFGVRGRPFAKQEHAINELGAELAFGIDDHRKVHA